MLCIISSKPIHCFSWTSVFSDQSGHTKKMTHFTRQPDPTNKSTKTSLKNGHNPVTADTLTNEPSPERPLPEDEPISFRESSMNDKFSNRFTSYPADRDPSSPISHHKSSHPKNPITETQPKVTDTSIHTSPNFQGSNDHSHQQPSIHPTDATLKTNHPLISKEITDIHKQLGPEMTSGYVTDRGVHRSEEGSNKKVQGIRSSSETDGMLKSSLAQGIEETIAGLTRVYHSLHLFNSSSPEERRQTNVSINGVQVRTGASEIEAVQNGSGNATENGEVDGMEDSVEGERKNDDADRFLTDQGKSEQQNSGRTGLLMVGLVSLIGAAGLVGFVQKRNRESEVQTPLYPPRGPSFV